MAKSPCLATGHCSVPFSPQAPCVDATLVLVIKQHGQEPQLNCLISESSSKPPQSQYSHILVDYVTQDALLLRTNSVMLVKWEKADKYFEANGGNNNKQ